MPANIIVNVLDDSGSPLSNAAVTLTGNGNPQMLLTDANGQCTFPNLPGRNYRLLAVHDRFNTTANSVTHADTADSTVTLVMKVVDEAGADGKKFFRLLTGLQYLFLLGLAGLFAYILIQGLTTRNLDLSNTEAARGMITFVVSVVTVAIALILVMSAAVLSGSKELDKRFAFGKDVFTILVGVLGTVMGFYYGQTAGETKEEPRLQILEVQLSPATPAINSAFTLTGTIAGGETPYTWVVTFDKPTAIKDTPMNPAESEDGRINREFTVTAEAPPNQPVNYEITATDKNGRTGTSKGSFTPAPAQASGS